ncbi:hypothetical protein L7F22_026679 [Adiantum nelumboides]|nr:hypothetical protein [Adiantum nelumboides]
MFLAERDVYSARSSHATNDAAIYSLHATTILVARTDEKSSSVVTDKIRRFEERDISKFCRLYEQSMEYNGIQDREAVDGFHLIVVPKLRTQIVELQTQQGTNLQEFKRALKEEYFFEDS